MKHEIFELITTFQNDSERISKDIHVLCAEGLLLASTDFFTFKSVKSLEKAFNETQEKGTDGIEEVTLDSNKDFLNYIPINIENYNYAISYMKPHLVDESTHEPILGKRTIILANNPEKLLQHNETIVRTHLLPGQEERDVEDPNIMHLYSLIANTIIDNEDSAKPYGLYRTYSRFHESATEDIAHQINNDIRLQMAQETPNSDSEMEK